MHLLKSPVRHYAWGSRMHIPRMCGLPETGEPHAEMWFGAHPADPACTYDGRRLDELIAERPAELLGEKVACNFGARLPFLMKLLGASEPLSLQVHPTSERARIRFAEQEAAGIPLTAPERTYVDASHKPELVYALTRFEGMAGFRDLGRSAQILRRLRLPWLDDVAARLEESQTPFQTLRAVVTELLATDRAVLPERLQELRSAALRAEQESHVPPARRRRPRVDPSDVSRESIRVFAALVPLVDRYPSDPGVLVTLLLNHVVLAAGEAMFVDAGVIHAYTSGFGLEIMASSDNVLRAGLTPKHVDTDEMLEITNFTPIPPPLWAPTVTERGSLLAPPVEEFELLILDEAAGDLRHPGPQILLCLEGSVKVRGIGDAVTLERGQAVLVAADEPVSLHDGPARLAIGRTPA